MSGVSARFLALYQGERASRQRGVRGLFKSLPSAFCLLPSPLRLLLRAARAVPLLLALSLPALAATPTLTPAQEAEATRISGNLRCPICTSQSITESANDVSFEMRAEVARMVAEGRSEGEIYDHFSARYGNFVLLDPPKEGAGLLLWLGPVLALGIGGAGLALWLRRGDTEDAATVATVSSHDYGTRDDLTAYLAEVRAEAATREGSQP